MKYIIVFLLATVTVSQATPPKKKPDFNYSPLWQNSPFTTRPIVDVNAPPPVNPLGDWALTGITKFPEGYFVILINKKKPDEKKIIEPGVESDFKVLEVIENIDDYRKTVVKLSSGSMTGEVTYDEKLLTLAAAPAAPAGQPGQPGQMGQPGQLNPNGQQMSMPNQSSNNMNGGQMNPNAPRTPRLRTVAPPQRQ